MTKPIRNLYVAYGSNLHKAGMRSRCPDAVPVGRIMLPHARLVFRGVADLEYDPDPNVAVPCGVWEISKRDERKLDTYEGVKTEMYYKDWGLRLKLQGESRKALVYRMYSTGVYPPSDYYANVIAKGYEDFGLDKAYLSAAIEASFKNKSPDRQTRERRARQRRSDQAALVRRPCTNGEAYGSFVPDDVPDLTGT